MLEEEFPSPGPKYPAERAAMWFIIIVGLLSSWLFGGAWLFGQSLLIALGWGTLFIILFHGHRELEFVGTWYLKVAAYLLPFWIIFGIYLIGLKEQPFTELMYRGDTYLSLRDSPTWWPTSSLPWDSWFPIFLGVGLYITALCMLLINEAEDVIRLILIVLSLSAAILGTLGIIQAVMGMERVLGIFLAPGDNYFSIFTHPHVWASYGLLWTGCMLGLMSHFLRHVPLRVFLDRGGIGFVAALLLLATSVVMSGTGLHVLCLGLLIAMSFFEYAGLLKGRNFIFKALCFAIGFLSFTAGVAVFTMTAQQAGLSALPSNLLPKAGLTMDELKLLYLNAWELFLAKPLFGWGEGSFRMVMTFTQDVNIGVRAFEAAHSDLLESLVERGLVGTLAWWIVPAYIFIQFLRLPVKRPLSWYLFGTCGLGLVLALVGFPFQLPAFTFSFWLLWFTAYRWSVIPHLVVTQPIGPTFAFSERELRQRIDRKPASPSASPKPAS